ncbi:McrB family protein [Exiguobacterium sp. OS-77]|uniref:McrB family protein n=1 Tax=Exiguobacterium sp. OS-77 TaxID=1241306 RepID=UPI000424944E|nr:AAA family ATPase [Exiguobacterium sp. OS-77]
MLIPAANLERSVIDQRLGIKSSIKNVKATLSLCFLIWKTQGHPSEVDYSLQYDPKKIILTDEVVDNLTNYLKPVYDGYNISDADFESKLNETPLLKGLKEHLNVLLELVLKIGKIDFLDENISLSAERSKNIRFSKKIKYSSNIDIIDSLFCSDEEGFKVIFLKWLGFDITLPVSHSQDLLNQLLTALSEPTVFKMKDLSNIEFHFNQEGIYKTLIENPGQQVNILGNSSEITGPLRIYKSMVYEDMHPYLSSQSRKNNNLSTKPSYYDFSSYYKRVSIYNDLNAKQINVSLVTSINEHPEQFEGSFELNRIVFGAPGTGKSYLLNNDCEKLISMNGGAFERVTFYPDYTYSNFVGTYKPVTSDDGTEIRYKFVPGPFLRTFVKAKKCEENKPYILLIEEINRAKVASVFGDMFQLLDRNEFGESEYAIHTTEDVKKYLAEKLELTIDECEEIKIPNNMFIWSTMNSADQGVFPLDTAFKRRWSFEYLGINEMDEEVNVNVFLGEGTLQKEINWNLLRRSINEKLLKDCKVNEDKLMGPYFLSKNILKSANDSIIDQENFKKAFKNKVIMYLFDDAARQHRKKMFEGCKTMLYSNICESFDKMGIEIFGSDVLEIYTRIKDEWEREQQNRQESIDQEDSNQESIDQEDSNQESIDQEDSNQESIDQEDSSQESSDQEDSNQESSDQEDSNQESSDQEDSNQESSDQEDSQQVEEN